MGPGGQADGGTWGLLYICVVVDLLLLRPSAVLRIIFYFTSFTIYVWYFQEGYEMTLRTLCTVDMLQKIVPTMYSQGR